MINLNDLKKIRDAAAAAKNFHQYEEQGRDIFSAFTSTLESVNITKLSKDKYSPWDVAYTSGGTEVIGEIKYRQHHPYTFEDWILEEEKLNDLSNIQQEIYNKKGIRPAIHYINIYLDGSIQIWDISNLKVSYVATEGLFPSTTCGDTSKRGKGVIYLNNKDKIKTK